MLEIGVLIFECKHRNHTVYIWLLFYCHTIKHSYFKKNVSAWLDSGVWQDFVFWHTAPGEYGSKLEVSVGGIRLGGGVGSECTIVSSRGFYLPSAGEVLSSS
jgi:hypothetical protein